MSRSMSVCLLFRKLGNPHGVLKGGGATVPLRQKTEPRFCSSGAVSSLEFALFDSAHFLAFPTRLWLLPLLTRGQEVFSPCHLTLHYVPWRHSQIMPQMDLKSLGF
jgi:hypothetical protein